MKVLGMNIETIATGAVSLLVSYFAKAGKAIANKVGIEVWDKVSNKVETLYQTIKNKFTDNDYANQTLKRLEEKPEDQGRQNAMEIILKEALIEDTQLQKMLGQLLAEAIQAGGDSIIQVYGSGAAASHGGIAAGEGGYAAGGDIIIDRVEEYENFYCLDIISRNEWNNLNPNERTITIKGDEIFTDLKDYKPPFDIKIIDIRERIGVFKFCIGNCIYQGKSFAMEMGELYKFSRWGISMNNLDEKNKGCIIKIREYK